MALQKRQEENEEKREERTRREIRSYKREKEAKATLNQQEAQIHGESIHPPKTSIIAHLICMMMNGSIHLNTTKEEDQCVTIIQNNQYCE